MVIIPLGIDRAGWAHGRTPFTIAVLTLAVFIAVCESWAWRWGGPIAAVADMTAWLRAYSGSSSALFRPWQMWTTALVHSSWTALMLSGVTWWICVGACERRVGTVLTATLVAIATPAASVSAIMVGRSMPDLGLLAPAIACGSGILGTLITPRIRWWWGWWLGRWAGSRIISSSLALWLLACTTAVLILLANGHDPRLHPQSAWPLAGIGLAISALIGQLLVRAVVAIREPLAINTLEQVLNGHASIDRIEAVLSTAENIHHEQLVRLAERAMHEQNRNAVRALIAHLVVHHPEAPLLDRLRQWIAR